MGSGALRAGPGPLGTFRNEGGRRRASRDPEKAMLDAFVIEEIKRRERERDDRPAVQIPLPPPPSGGEDEPSDAPASPDRGVIIIDYGAPVTR